MKKIITIFGFLLLITTTLYPPMTTAAGEKGWCTITGRKPGGINGYNEACTGAPQTACKIQKDTYAPNAILGSYSSTGHWWKKKCDWTICRGLSPYQCSYIHPGSVDFECNNEGVRLSSADYLIRVPPGACIKRSSYSAIPNFDTSSRIVFFPRVTVNSKKVYTNVK